MSKSIFITTTIPYVNSKPHVGHAQEFALADALARQFRREGHTVTLQSGTDDNAFKNVLSAKAAGIPTAAFVDQNAKRFQELLAALNIQPNVFVRTSSEAHQKLVAKFLASIPKEDLYKNSYEGLYCQGCEDFYEESELANGECPDHKTKPQSVREENVFFRLSRYQQKIREAIETDEVLIRPQWRKKEILHFIDRGLRDLSISRPAIRSGNWGIPFPGEPEHVVYVWIDALINYLTAETLWDEQVHKIHIIGKNVWKFHAIYWLGLLLSTGRPLPDEIWIHGFLTCDGIKISKSLGNGVDPIECIRQHGADAVRFYLLHELFYFEDADYVETHLIQAYNAELANKLGNLLSRVQALSVKSGLTFYKESPTLQTPDLSLKESWNRAFTLVHQANAEIHNERPWEWLPGKASSTTTEECAIKLQEKLQAWRNRLHEVADLLDSVIPEGAERLREILKGESAAPLFPRINP